MKKLILVTALAVAASWLLSEPGSSREERAARAEVVRVSRLLRDRTDDLLVAPPRPPMPPEPPAPPASIRTIPWNKKNRGQLAKADGTPRPVAPQPAARRIPDWFPRTDDEEKAASRPDASGSRVLLGQLSASEDRARRDLRTTVEREVSRWLAADVPTSWKPPEGMISALVGRPYVQEVIKDLVPAPPESGSADSEADADGLYTLYRAGQKLDFSAARRAQFLAEYRRELGVARLKRLGGGLAVALVGLAVLSSYIKADEATKGYYTNRLRLLAGAGLGAAGVAAYRFLV